MIVAGFGFRSAATIQSLMDVFKMSGAQNIDAVATIDDKSITPTFVTFAASLNLRIIPVAPDSLKKAETTTLSLASLTHRSAGSVAEAAALCAAGEGAELRAPRFISQDRMATCAIAQSPICPVVQGPKT